ncbi:MAG: AraC family transcriptional regulator [Blastocatellia bacterium]
MNKPAMQKIFNKKKSRELSLWQGKFAIWEGGGAYFGNTFDTNFHQHHALQICIAPEGNFRLKVSEEDDWLICESAIIDSNTNHQIDGQGICILLIYLDPEQRLSRTIRKKMKAEKILLLSRSYEVGDILNQLQLNTLEKTELLAVIEKILVSFFLDEQMVRSVDPRVKTVINRIKSMAGMPIAAMELAQIVNLSESRLAHLFNEQTGIPIRRYILWVRLQKAVAEMLNGNSLTEVAHESGFSDSAHFTRTFRKMFGIIPSKTKLEP